MKSLFGGIIGGIITILIVSVGVLYFYSSSNKSLQQPSVSDLQTQSQITAETWWVASLINNFSKETAVSAELKYMIEDKFGKTLAGQIYSSPVWGADAEKILKEAVLAIFPTAQASDAFGVITKHLGLSWNFYWSYEDKAAVVAEFNRLKAIQLYPASDGYTFTIRISTSKFYGKEIAGFIAPDGTISDVVEKEFVKGPPPS
ncbi:MAG: hypothetical protein AAB897_03780 [Patescibacteria group bacterium]